MLALAFVVATLQQPSMPAVCKSTTARHITKQEYNYRMRKLAAGQLSSNPLLGPQTLLGGQPPVGCRVSPQTTEWYATRTIPAATGSPTQIVVDLCVFVTRTVSLEHFGVFQGCIWSMHSTPVILQGSFDPTFRRSFLVGTAIVTLPDDGGVLSTYDGSFDLGGTSGVSHTVEDQVLVTSTLQILDPTFFQTPWPLYIRAIGGFDNGQESSVNVYYACTTLAAAGVSVTY